MKKIILTISVFFLFTFSFAQKEYEYVPFPTSNAIWSEVYHFSEFDPNGTWQPVYECFTVNGEDTVINGIVYTKIYMFLDTVFDKKTARYVGSLREDENKRIWLKVDTPLHRSKPLAHYGKDEILLYDFSVNEGDTIISSRLNINYYEKGVLVRNIDTIQVGNTYRRKIELISSHFHNNPDIGHPEIIEWIEGIGSINGLFFAPWLDRQIYSCEDNYLIGFKYQDEILYFDDEYPSFYPTNIQTINSPNSGKVQINSTQNGLLFDCRDKDIAIIQIFNILGVLQTTLQNEFILYTDSYSSGIYLYRAIDNSGNNYSGKFSIIK
jgi:hypothetical protein